MTARVSRKRCRALPVNTSSVARAYYCNLATAIILRLYLGRLDVNLNNNDFSFMENQIPNGFRTKHIVVTRKALGKKPVLSQTKNMYFLSFSSQLTRVKNYITIVFYIQ